MAQHADEHEHTAHSTGPRKLVRLSNSGFRLTNRESDVRGMSVFDPNGDRIGSVEDFFVDPGERRVYFLEVGAGGFLGLGKKRFLVPVEAVTGFREGGVTVDQSRGKVNEPLPFNTRILPQDR